MRLIAALLGCLSLGLGGCAATCEDACANYARVCEAEFKASSLAFDLDRCADSCDANLEGCTNSLERTRCLAGAGDCAAARACPGCAR